ncbi:MAG: hypothetical protein HYU64_13115 [Armatimonadetes bacterium]|nr:hypothetical protein [Armatimonadota bacterium]
MSVNLFESIQAEYFIFGAIATSYWGYPRFTRDVDIIFRTDENEFDALLEKARELGFNFDAAQALGKLENSKVARLKYSDYHVDLVVGESFFDHSAFQRKVKVRLFNRDIYVASAEDIILYKLVSSRRQDLADIEKIILANREPLDRQYLFAMAEKLAKELGMPHIRETLIHFLEAL